MVRTLSDITTGYENKRVTELDELQPAMGYKEIGELFGIHKSRVQQIHDKAIRKLRRAWKESE